MEGIKIVLKCVWLFFAITYSFTCFGRLIRKQDVHGAQIFLMALGIVGFITLQFWI